MLDMRFPSRIHRRSVGASKTSGADSSLNYSHAVSDDFCTDSSQFRSSRQFRMILACLKDHAGEIRANHV